MNNLQPSSFPIQGIIGIISSDPSELALAVKKNLHSVEIRADLLMDNGHSLDDILDVVVEAKNRGISSLFTLRHASQGGKFNQNEQQRVAVCRQAIAAGTDIIDLEWGTDSAKELLSDGFPIILSYHNFDRMLSDDELKTLTSSMSAGNPAAIKIIPTVTSVTEAATLLRWVESAEPTIRRIGFGMGESGVISRILTLACGAPVSYAAFANAVAPGQIALDHLLEIYRAMELNAQTRVLALIDNSTQSSQLLAEINHQLAEHNKNGICVQIKHNDCAEMLANSRTLRVCGMRVAQEEASVISGLGHDLTASGPHLVALSESASSGEPLKVTPYSERSMLALFD